MRTRTSSAENTTSMARRRSRADATVCSRYADGWMGAAGRRRLAAVRALRDGGYLDLAAGRARPPRRNAGISRDIAGAPHGRGVLVPHGGWRRRAAGHGTPATAVARRYMDAWQAAAYLGISESLLNRMRVSGKEPRCAKLGERVVKDFEDLDAWLVARERRFTGEVRPG